MLLSMILLCIAWWACLIWAGMWFGLGAAALVFLTSMCIAGMHIIMEGDDDGQQS